MGKIITDSQHYTDIANAIRAKSGTTTQYKPGELADAITSIPTKADSKEMSDVNFFDMDGTLLYSYTLEEAQSLAALPAPISRGGLEGSWNWSLDDIHDLTGKMNIGARYYINCGNMSNLWEQMFAIDVTCEAQKTKKIACTIASAFSTVSWGDGTVETRQTLLSSTSTGYISHTYEELGKYTIVLRSMLLPRGNAPVFGNNMYDRTLLQAYLQTTDTKPGIGDYVFEYQYRLREVGSDYGGAGAYTFGDCYSLEFLTSESAKIGASCLSNCSSLKHISLSKSVTEIGNSAFQNCYALQEIYIPEGVTSIGDNAFENCYNLGEITLPSTLESIGANAFDNCNSLKSITIPAGLKSITETSIWFLPSLEACHMQSETPPECDNIEAWELFNVVSENFVLYVPEGCVEAYQLSPWSNMGHLTIEEEPSPDGDITLVLNLDEAMPVTLTMYVQDVTGTDVSIDKIVWGDGSKTDGSEITASVETSGIEAASVEDDEDAGAPTSTESTDDDTSADDSATAPTDNADDSSAADTEDDSSVDDAETEPTDTGVVQITHQYKAAGEYKIKVRAKNVYIGAAATYFGSSKHISLLSSTIEDVVDEEGNESQTITESQASAALTSVTIGDGIMIIDDYAFYNCTALANVDLGETITEIEDHAFYGCTALETIDIINPLVLNKIDTAAFANSGLTVFNPEYTKVIEIADELFANCTKLTSVKWDYLHTAGVIIGKRAFYGCTALTSVDFGGCTVTTIGESAFEDSSFGASGTESEPTTLPDTVTTIGENAFRNCGSLQYLTIPGSVENMGAFAFAESGIQSVTLSSGITTIGNGAFYKCEYLTDISWSDTLVEIGDQAFMECTKCEFIGYLPTSLETIGDSAFEGCTSAVGFNMRGNVKSIGDRAFYRSTNTFSIEAETPPTIPTTGTVFGGVESYGILVNEGLLETYQTAEGWSDYKDHIEENKKITLDPIESVVVKPGTTDSTDD